MADPKIHIELDFGDAIALPHTLRDRIEEVRRMEERRATLLCEDDRNCLKNYIGQLERCRTAIVKAIDPDGRFFT